MKIFKKFCPLITVALLIAIWYAMAAIVNMKLIMPTPYDTLKEMLRVFGSAKFYVALFGSAYRAVISFTISFVFAVAFALLSNAYSVFERLFYPLIVIVRATPTMSVIFLCLIWFSSKISPIIVSVTIILPTLYSAVTSAVKSCDDKIIEMSKVYKVPRAVMVKNYYLPHITGTVFDDTVSALSLNVKLIVAAEALAQTSKGLGVLMQIAKLNLETATLFAYTAGAVILSFLFELLLKAIRLVVKEVKRAKTNRNY